jgi:hypothetical protein
MIGGGVGQAVRVAAAAGWGVDNAARAVAEAGSAGPASQAARESASATAPTASTAQQNRREAPRRVIVSVTHLWIRNRAAKQHMSTAPDRTDRIVPR